MRATTTSVQQQEICCGTHATTTGNQWQGTCCSTLVVSNTLTASERQPASEQQQDGRPSPVVLDIEIKVTNLWPNRLIGDEALCKPDCEWVEHPHRGLFEYSIKEIPQWVKEGKPSPAGRRAFTTWRHWTKDDALQPSGLIGPVMIRFGEPAHETIEKVSPLVRGTVDGV